MGFISKITSVFKSKKTPNFHISEIEKQLEKLSHEYKDVEYKIEKTENNNIRYSIRCGKVLFIVTTLKIPNKDYVKDCVYVIYDEGISKTYGGDTLENIMKKIFTFIIT